MNSRIKELLTNSLLFTLANLGSRILVFLMVPFYTTVLSSSQFGDANIIQTTGSFLYPILTCLIAEAVLRFCFIDGQDLVKIFSIGVRWVTVAFIVSVVLCLLYFIIPFVNEWGPNVIFIPLIVVSYSFSRLMHCFCRGINKVKYSAYAGLLQTIVVIGCNLIFLWLFKWGVSGYLSAFVLGDLMGGIFMFWKVSGFKYVKSHYDDKLAKSMLKYSLPLVPNQMSWWAVSSVNQYIVLGFMGISAVGIYTATLRLPTILTVLSEIFAQAWLLTALKNYGTDESKAFIVRMHKRFFKLVATLTSGIILLSYPLAKILLRGSFSDYWYITPFLFISVFLGALTGFLGSIYSAERKNTIQALSTVIGAVIVIILSFVLIRIWGIIGIAVSTLFGNYIIMLIRQIGVKKFIVLESSLIHISWQITLLIIEGMLVMNQLYWWATGCFVFLVVMNINVLKDTGLFVKQIAADFLKSHFNKH